MEQSIREAKRLFKEKKYQEAINICIEILKKDCKSIDALKLTAKCFSAERNIKDSRLYLNKVISIKSDDYQSIKELGNSYVLDGDLNKAREQYYKAIAINNNYAPALTNLGALEIQSGNKKNGISLLIKATKSDSKCFNSWGNLAIGYINLGEQKKAEIACRKSIELKPDNFKAYLTLATILKYFGKADEAEFSIRKAIQLQPNSAESHSFLGSILIDLGKLKEAENSCIKAIEINPNHIKGYFVLSTLKSSNKTQVWQNKLFTEEILKGKKKEDQIDIYFARANLLHKEKQYKESSKYYILANKSKLTIHPSKSDKLIQKNKLLLQQSKNLNIQYKDDSQPIESIFIVGMPRSGSTLIESIISTNDKVYPLGEINILEESFIEFLDLRVTNKELDLTKLYRSKVKEINSDYKITTNKWLYNYQYAGVISQMANTKIIHCCRNPLDNILSIHRTNFARGNEYSTSLIESTKIYLDQQSTIEEYKKRFPSKIYSVDYDLLVRNPHDEIKLLISWLGWVWSEAYLSPELNIRSISTASNVQVRSPINSRSIGGWINYKEMLEPAIRMIKDNETYKNKIFDFR